MRRYVVASVMIIPPFLALRATRCRECDNSGIRAGLIKIAAVQTKISSFPINISDLPVERIDWDMALGALF